MRLLIYSHPLATNGDPNFGLNAFRNKLLKVAEVAAQRHIQIDIAAPGHYLQASQRIHSAHYIELNGQDFISATGIAGDLDFHFYGSARDTEAVNKAADILRRLIPNEPDVIVVWEAAVPHLRKAFSKARIISLMPCPFSRVPYGDMVMVDPTGLFKEGYLHRDLPSQLTQFTPSSRELSALARLRTKMTDFFGSKDRVKDELSRLREGRQDFSSLSLLPLQVSAHYAFRRDAQFLTQFEMLEHVLASSSEQTGIVTTQYVTKNISERALNADTAGYLDSRYKNFLYNQSFDKLHNISQYLLPFVDSVITFSSSLAFQALLLEKSTSIVGDSYISNLFSVVNNDEELRDKLLIFLLFRYSVLFPQALGSDEIFKWLLNPAYEKSLLEINGYEEAFFDGLRFSTAEKELTRDLQYWPISTSLPDTVTTAVKKAELISFDIFDTLIERPLLDPKHVFHVIQERIYADAKLPNFNFAKARVEAERIAHSVLDDGREEVTFADIYEVLQKKYELSQTDIDKLKNLEIETEYELMVSRPVGEKLYRYCIEQNKRVIYTSDMYLSREVILKLLKKCGYSDQHPLYLSSEIGKKKKTGTIFPHVGHSERTPLDKILHIGDNPVGDVTSAVAHGISVLHVRRAINGLQAHRKYKSLFGNIAFTDIHTSAVGYLIARHLFDDPFAAPNDSLFRQSPYELGYCGLGPCVTDYALWLDKQVVQNGHDHVFFIARDGRIIKEVFEIVRRSTALSTYAWGSRRLLRGATTENTNEFLDIIDDIEVAPLEDIIYDRFGYHLDQSPELSSDVTRLEKIRAAKQVFAALKEKINNRKNILSQYCYDIGMTTAKNPCLVEIGYAATIQEGYQKLIGAPLAGYYMVLLDTALSRFTPERPMVGYVGNFAQRFNFWHPLTGYSQIFETLFCSDEDTIVDASRNKDGRLIPIRDVTTGDFKRKALIREVHAGARQFSRDAKKLLGPLLDEMRPNPEVGARVLKDFLERPTRSDALILEGITFENGFSRNKVLHVIPPKSKYRNYTAGKFRTAWKQGSDAVTAATASGSAKEAPKKKVPSGSVILQQRELPALRKPLKPVVRPFVRRLGTKKDLREFDADPVAFFAKLRNPGYRLVGRILFNAA
jgi:FMN phosphatase YigB (HAD superfamily)